MAMRQRHKGSCRIWKAQIAGLALEVNDELRRLLPPISQPTDSSNPDDVPAHGSRQIAEYLAVA